MSGSITFRRGPLQGWSIALHATYADGELVRMLVQIGTPWVYGRQELSGVLSFAPGVDGYDVAERAERRGGPDRMAALLVWIIEAHRRVLATSTTIDDGSRRHWQAIVDWADETRADFHARYPGGVVPAFEVIDRVLFEPSGEPMQRGGRLLRPTVRV